MTNGERPLRVLQICEATCAGVGGHVLDLCHGLSSSDCEVHLIYSPRRIDGFFRQRLEELKSARLTPLTMRRGPHWSDISASRQIKKYLVEHGPFDIVHGHSTKAGLIARLKSISRNHKVVYTPNGIYTMNPIAKRTVQMLARVVEKSFARRSNAIIAVSPHEEQHMLELGIPADLVTMIPNGLRQIDWKCRSVLRSELLIDEDDFVVGFLGRFAGQKNPLLLIESFARLRQGSSRQLVLAMAGSGPLENQGRALAEKLGISDRVKWLGFKTAQQTMPAFDVFVMPSRYEGMPYVLMEAVSAGLPVVATQVGGANLGIDHDSNGFIVPSEDPDALANAIQALIDSPATNKRFSRNALLKAREFDVSFMVQRTYDLYCRLVGFSGRKPSATKSTSKVVV